VRRYGGHLLWLLGLATAATGLLEMDDEAPAILGKVARHAVAHH
jgi:hypothetical protein